MSNDTGVVVTVVQSHRIHVVEVAMGQRGLSGTDTAGGGGLPSGGSSGQVPVKVDSTDFNVTWSDLPPAPTYSIADITGLSSVLSSKVDASRVLTDVPLGAQFTDTDTDTVYDDTAIQAAVDLNTAKKTNVVHPLVEKAVPPNAKFTDTVYSHPTNAGNKHIPSGGTVGQVLKNSASGIAVWSSDTSDYVLPFADNSANWNTAFGWGDHASAGYSKTDTVYDDTVLEAAVSLNTAKKTNVVHPLVEKAVPANAKFTDTNTTYSALSEFTNDAGFVTLAEANIDNVPTKVVTTLPASPVAGTLYIVTE